MYNYEYNNINQIDLTQIHQDIILSAMSDKSIEWCRWDEETKILKITFTNELSSNDKTILDQIINDLL